MRKAAFIGVVLMISGCATKMPTMPADASYMHWSDTTIAQDHPEFSLVCNSDGKVIGRIESYGSSWYASPSIGFADSEYESEESASKALVSFSKKSGSCIEPTK